MNAPRRSGSEFLVNVIVPRGWGLERVNRRPRAAGWVRAAMVVQAVILILVLGWLLSGQPGLDVAGRYVEAHLGYQSGDVLGRVPVPAVAPTASQAESADPDAGAATRL